MFLKRFLPVLLLLIPFFALSQEKNMAMIKEGNYTPLYGRDSTKVQVDAFKMDTYPVTNGEFEEFVKENPAWQKNSVKALFADANYLRGWNDDNSISEGLSPNSPVTNVSYFAARKYCECQGKRLPTLDEWEYVAMADETTADARKKDDYNEFILGWYEKPSAFDDEVGSTFKNYWGVYDMHGLVWEWTSDFNSVLISGESRSDLDEDNNLFCGSAAIGSSDLMNYAAFMRYAFRGSIKANYNIRTLGFRCAKDLTINKEANENF